MDRTLQTDPSTSLAISMQANKGIFALLLGSGISVPAQIPSGWEVLINLIERLAVTYDQDCHPDPIQWYRERFGTEPTYSMLLEQVAPSPALRRGLLDPLFQPLDEDERLRGVKMPTDAHKAIAELARDGYIRIILTTNFDPLIELALQEKGVNPAIIASADDARGALPFDPSMCYVVKIHGDYHDARIRNTTDELRRYEQPLARLLDRVFAEHGLIICGWSGETDPALRDALARITVRRYPTFWVARSAPREMAQNIMGLRKADLIASVTANEFFTQLAERVVALESATRPHPLSTAMAVEILKQRIELSQTIRLTDLIHDATNAAVSALSDGRFDRMNEGYIDALISTLKERISRYEAITETIRALVATGCYWGQSSLGGLWVEVVQRIANTGKKDSGANALLAMQRYPATLTMYAGAIAAVDAKRYDVLASLFLEPRIPTIFGGEVNSVPCVGLMPTITFVDRALACLPHQGYTAASDHIFEILRPTLRGLIPSDERYERSYARFECLMALSAADVQIQASDFRVGFYGRYVSYEQTAPAGYRWPTVEPLALLRDEAVQAGSDWAMLRAGMFGGSLDRFLAAHRRFTGQDEPGVSD